MRIDDGSRYSPQSVEDWATDRWFGAAGPSRTSTCLDNPILKPPLLRLAGRSAAEDLFSWLEIGGTIGSALLFFPGAWFMG